MTQKIWHWTGICLLSIIALDSHFLEAFAGGAAVAKRRQGGQQVAQQQAMQQAAIQRQMAIRAAQQSAQNAAIHATQEIQAQGTVHVPAPVVEATSDVLVSHQPIDESQVKDVVDIEDLWEAFETTSQNWTLMMEERAKVLTVERSITHFQENGITIAKSPVYYSQMIDGLSQQNPSMLNQPFNNLLQFMAIMEYDFDNGTDRDQLAKKFLGEQFWKSNRQRLGLDAIAQPAQQ